LSQQQQTQHVGVFTTELFARYLCIRYLSVTECGQLIPTPLTDEIRRYRKHFCESPETFITDALAFKLVHGYPGYFRILFAEDQTNLVTSDQLDTSELVELLKQSAVEHLTTCRQLMAQKFGSVFTIVTADYEALYAYKRGEYQRCLQLATENVRALIAGSESMSLISAYPELIQLMGGDIVSLSGLMLIADPSARRHGAHMSVTQLSLSLYLMTECQLQLMHHSVTSLAQTLRYIQVARLNVVRQRQRYTLDQLLLKLIEKKVLRCIRVEGACSL